MMGENIFGYHLWVDTINPSSYNKNNIISTVDLNYKIQPSRNNWDWESNLHHTYNDIDNTTFHNVDYSELIPLYTQSIEKYLRETQLYHPFTFSIDNYTVINKNQYMGKHQHLKHDFVAVHYISYDSQYHHPLTFWNDNPEYKWLNDKSDYIRKSSRLPSEHSRLLDRWVPHINEDDIIIFPSNLTHSVEPIKGKDYKPTDKNRIAVALNINLG